MYIDTVSEEATDIEDVIDITSEDGMLITRTKMMVHEDDGAGRTQTMYVADFPDVTVSKETILDWANKVATSLTIVAVLAMWGVFFIGIAVWKGLYLVVLSFVAWVVARIAKKEWLFEDVYTVSLFAQTLPSLLAFGLFALGIEIAYAYSVLVIAILLFITFQKPAH